MTPAALTPAALDVGSTLTGASQPDRAFSGRSADSVSTP